MDIVQAFEDRAKGDPAMTGAALEDVLRLVPGKRAILSGRYAGRRAVFRFHIDEPQKNATRNWAELTRAFAYMCDGDLRVNAPLDHAPELGLVVVEHVQGMPLMQRLWRAPHAARAEYLAPAARWLRKYTAPTEERIPARLEGWLSRARKAAASQPYEHLRPVEAALLAEMERIAPALAGTPWRVAICHGDFHPNNLLVEGTRLTGIDTGGSAKLPVYKDMARFLAHMGRRGLIPSGQRRFGVDRAGLDAFAGAFALGEMETALALPFMIGVEALIRVESKALSRSRIRRSEAFYEELLGDMRELDR